MQGATHILTAQFNLMTTERRQQNPPLKQTLMLGLIYPAVLGSILYTLLQTVTYIATGKMPLIDPVTIKLSLLVITITFYVCDYFYIMFTTRYYWLFFICDIIFLITLYATVVAIDLNVGSYGPPYNRVILFCYVIFLILYFVWDVCEAVVLRGSREGRYFIKVVIWESLFLITIGIFLYTSWGWDDDRSVSLWTCGILCAITLGFVYLVRKKREFSSYAY